MPRGASTSRGTARSSGQWSNFLLLAANIYQDGKRMFPPYAIFERGGYKIAVMGLTTEDTQKFSLPANILGIEFRKPIPEAIALRPARLPRPAQPHQDCRLRAG